MKNAQTVVIALGSSLDDKHLYLKDALHFLHTLFGEDLKKSSIWETDPVGPSKNTFYNAVVMGETTLKPWEIFKALKKHESETGRNPNAAKWTDREIDLDIIAYGSSLYIDADLEIPHPRYIDRLFVLEPLREIAPNWLDLESGEHIENLIMRASPLRLSKTSLKW
jgi:2-amino-4-hydroxy-6-hydroxymethyldihydropteridine diphosphokinase